MTSLDVMLARDSHVRHLDHYTACKSGNYSFLEVSIRDKLYSTSSRASLVSAPTRVEELMSGVSRNRTANDTITEDIGLFLLVLLVRGDCIKYI
jgi:hypothetical protein